MPTIIGVEIMKIIDEITKEPENKNKKKQKGARGTEPIVKGWELNYFVVYLS